MGRPPLRGRPWGPHDLTGGPVDQVFTRLRTEFPHLVVERVDVTHPGDDDNLFFVGDDRGFEHLHVETYPGGQPPFLIAEDEQFHTSDVAEAVAAVRSLLLERRESQ
jgi:hypothetical protein